MTTLQEAAEMALEALEYYRSGEDYQPTPASDAITKLCAALAEQTVPSDYSNSHQPDAWRTEARNDLGLPVFFCASEVKQAGPGLIPLYTAPPQRKPLTEEQLVEAYCCVNDKEWAIGGMTDARIFARAIERAHGIGDEK
jgi:hypothetical protein